MSEKTLWFGALDGQLCTVSTSPRRRFGPSTGARVVDGTDRAPIDNATIVSGTAGSSPVGAGDRVTIPPGAARVSLAGKTVIPVLVTHTVTR